MYQELLTLKSLIELYTPSTTVRSPIQSVVLEMFPTLKYIKNTSIGIGMTLECGKGGGQCKSPLTVPTRHQGSINMVPATQFIHTFI